jgi:hypothetical protein
VHVERLLSEATSRERAQVRVQAPNTKAPAPSRLKSVDVSYLIKEFDSIYTESPDSSYSAFLG